MTLLQDILSSDLSENNRRIIVEEIYNASFTRDKSCQADRTQSPKIALNTLSEVYEKITKAVLNYEQRIGITEKTRITVTQEDPDLALENLLKNPADSSASNTSPNVNSRGIITLSCLKRNPGSFSQGTPFEGKIKNLRPILRQEVQDPQNPGYRIAVLGYWYDNLVRTICWARTNKGAEKIATDLETLMDEYSWWFKAEGIDRVIFWGRDSDIVREVNGNKFYGRPLDYFIRTEKIKMLSEKEIEQITIELTLSNQ